MKDLKKTLNSAKIEKKVDLSPIDNNVIKKSIKNNYDLELLDGTEAYYSERYGWTLRKSKQ